MSRPRPLTSIKYSISCGKKFQGWYETEIVRVASYQRYIPSKDD